MFLNQPSISAGSAIQLEQLYRTSRKKLQTITADQIFAYILENKLDDESRELYENSKFNCKDVPDLNYLLNFMEERCRVLEFVVGQEKCKHFESDYE